MRAEFIGCTLVVTPETEREKEELRYHSPGSPGSPGHAELWECFGWEEDEQSWSAQGLCPVGLQDHEILDYLRYMMELDPKPRPDFTDQKALFERLRQDSEIMDRIRAILES